jgi:hypothetical protein
MDNYQSYSAKVAVQQLAKAQIAEEIPNDCSAAAQRWASILEEGRLMMAQRMGKNIRFKNTTGKCVQSNEGHGCEYQRSQ